MSTATPATTDDPSFAAILAWWDANRRELPWRATRDIYSVWVAEVMSAQTSVLRAVAAWEAWIDRWPTVEALASASLADVLSLWRGLGYPRRARDLYRSAQLVAAAGWPADFTVLPGVGAYVAAAIRCFALEEPELPRDVNVSRVLARRFQDGVDISGDPWRAGQAIMEFGQRVCTVRPDCAACPVNVGCPGPQAGEAVVRRARRQKPYQGSLRQRRGRLLNRVLSGGRVVESEADAEAAAGLVQDGLIIRDGPWLRAPA